MSGIAGVFHLDSAPPDRELGAQMAKAIEFRGPDGTHVWSGDGVFLAHTLLRTTYDAEGESQPASVDRQVWITADARIDAREDLIRELGLPSAALARPDCELILHAYAKWGADCTTHLLGDFAFAIWDGRRRELFCARDQFGVKPFFYSLAGSAFVFSNTLDCIRVHREVRDELNPLAIADFLVFGFNQDPSTTTFREIHRLPAAHALTVSDAGISVSRYWSLPDDERIRYRHTQEYVEHFRALIGTAVSDRLRRDRVAVYMSGGLDSTAVAAFAKEVAPKTEIKAFTWTWDGLIKDDEGLFAGIAARGIGAEIEYLPWADAKPLEGSLATPYPEPYSDLFRAATMKECRRVACYAPVALTGHGADPVFSPSALTSCGSVRAVPLLEFARNCVAFARDQKAVPRFRLRSTLRRLLGLHRGESLEAPAWLNPEFSRLCEIQDRVDGFLRPVAESNDTRPEARRFLSNRFWPWLFESQEDAGWTGAALEYRNPYFDLRLVRWLLSIPELPYMMDKWLLRLALRGLLPEPVRTRKKTPLRCDPNLAALRVHGLDAAPAIRPHKRMDEFVNWNDIPMFQRGSFSQSYWVDIRPISLNHWFISQEDFAWKKERLSRTVSPTLRRSSASTVM